MNLRFLKNFWHHQNLSSKLQSTKLTLMLKVLKPVWMVATFNFQSLTLFFVPFHSLWLMYFKQDLFHLLAHFKKHPEMTLPLTANKFCVPIHLMSWLNRFPCEILIFMWFLSFLSTRWFISFKVKSLCKGCLEADYNTVKIFVMKKENGKIQKFR